MKFENGSQWRTRGGWRAVVVSTQNSLCVWHDENHQNNVFIHYKHNGRRIGYGEKDYDLIEPWVEPIKLTFWVNVYKDDFCGHNTQQEAEDGAFLEGRLDTIQIDYVQGKTHYVAKGK